MVAPLLITNGASLSFVYCNVRHSMHRFHNEVVEDGVGGLHRHSHSPC